MNIIISNADPRPIYEQIGAAVREAIVSGEVAAGEALPSIRALAKDLRVSVITTKRAFEELERDGYIETVPGKGSFAADVGAPLLRERRLREMEDHLRQALALGRSAGLDAQAVAQALILLSKEDI